MSLQSGLFCCEDHFNVRQNYRLKLTSIVIDDIHVLVQGNLENCMRISLDPTAKIRLDLKFHLLNITNFLQTIGKFNV